MGMTVIEVLINFVPNPRKISPFSKKKLLFLRKTQAYLASWQLKNLSKRLKTVFSGENLVFKGLILRSKYICRTTVIF